MHIFYASDTTPNSAFASNLWRNNLLLPLQDLGHEVVEFDYDLRLTFQHLDPEIPAHRAFIAKNRPRVVASLLRQIKEAHTKKPFDLFFSYFLDACITPDALEEIGNMGVTTVNWYCNGSYQLRLVQEIAPHYDWCLVPEKFRLDDYRAMGAQPIYCQEAANPSIYRPFNLPQEFPVTFIGQAYGERPGAIRHLLDHDISVQVFGYGWPQFSSKLTLRKTASKILRGTKNQPKLPEKSIGGRLSDEEMIKMYSRSKINLGFSSCDTPLGEARVLQVRLRDFEVPMSGGFYMVEYMPELEEFYEIGTEIVCYSDLDDLVEKIKYYLAHESERMKIAAAGRARCLNDHTWQKRFHDAFREMGLDPGTLSQNAQD